MYEKIKSRIPRLSELMICLVGIGLVELLTLALPSPGIESSRPVIVIKSVVEDATTATGEQLYGLFHQDMGLVVAYAAVNSSAIGCGIGIDSVNDLSGGQNYLDLAREEALGDFISRGRNSYHSKGSCLGDDVFLSKNGFLWTDAFLWADRFLWTMVSPERIVKRTQFSLKPLWSWRTSPRKSLSLSAPMSRTRPRPSWSASA